MTRAAAEAVECLLEKPVFVFVCIWVCRRRTNNCYFIQRDNSLAKSVFAVALFKLTITLDRKIDKKAETIKSKNWGKTITL
jgi:hypothetical protein